MKLFHIGIRTTEIVSIHPSDKDNLPTVYVAREDLRIYNQLVNEFYIMCDYVEDPPVKDAGDPIYSRAELEAAGQGTLI